MLRDVPENAPAFSFFYSSVFFSLHFFSFKTTTTKKKRNSLRRTPCILTIVFSYSFHKSLQEEEPLPALNTE